MLISLGSIEMLLHTVEQMHRLLDNVREACAEEGKQFSELETHCAEHGREAHQAFEYASTRKQQCEHKVEQAYQHVVISQQSLDSAISHLNSL